MLQAHIPAKSQSPEFDPAFASEADTMFSFGQGPCGLASSVEQLQRRLRLSDVGLNPSIAQMRPEDALIIHVCAHTCYLLLPCSLTCTVRWHHASLAQFRSCVGGELRIACLMCSSRMVHVVNRMMACPCVCRTWRRR